MIRLTLASVGACALGGALTYQLAALRLNAALNLPPLNRKPICHGYATCCACRDCKHREKHGHKAAKPAPQPWEAKAA